jgi:hypothetical protein
VAGFSFGPPPPQNTLRKHETLVAACLGFGLILLVIPLTRPIILEKGSPLCPDKRPLPPKKLRDFRGGSPKILPDHDSKKKGSPRNQGKEGTAPRATTPSGASDFFGDQSTRRGIMRIKPPKEIFGAVYRLLMGTPAPLQFDKNHALEGEISA